MEVFLSGIDSRNGEPLLRPPFFSAHPLGADQRYISEKITPWRWQDVSANWRYICKTVVTKPRFAYAISMHRYCQYSLCGYLGRRISLWLELRPVGSVADCGSAHWRTIHLSRGRPFVVEIGTGKVIQGWDEGVSLGSVASAPLP